MLRHTYTLAHYFALALCTCYGLQTGSNFTIVLHTLTHTQRADNMECCNTVPLSSRLFDGAQHAGW